MEFINEFIIYSTSYFMIIFSDWFTNVQLRYDIGFIYLYLNATIILLNIFLILYSMFIGLIKIRRKKVWYNALRKIVIEKKQLIKTILSKTKWNSKFKKQ